jgi:hypothetical protein
LFKLLFLSFMSFGQVTITDSQDLVFVNELKNGGFENGLSNWTSTGDVTTTFGSYTTPSKQFGKRFLNMAFGPSTTGVVEQVITVPTQIQGQPCRVEFWSNISFNVTGYELQVLNSSNTLLEASSIQNTSAQLNRQDVTFLCPSSSTIKIRFAVLLGSSRTIKVDNVSLSAFRQRGIAPYIYVTDQQTRAVSENLNCPSGSAVVGLNKIAFTTATGPSSLSNFFVFDNVNDEIDVLVTGLYEVEFFAQGYRLNRMGSYLFNVTDGVRVTPQVRGYQESSTDSTAASVRYKDNIILTAGKSYALFTFASSTAGTANSFGVQVNDSVANFPAGSSAIWNWVRITKID